MAVSFLPSCPWGRVPVRRPPFQHGPLGSMSSKMPTPLPALEITIIMTVISVT